MNAIRPCRSVKEWLKDHEITKLPPGHALGLSEIERRTGLIANKGTPWRETITRQNLAATKERKGKRHARTDR